MHPSIDAVIEVLWEDLASSADFSKSTPLLAHYTSIQTLEKIICTNELWFSNPLFMNDLEEVQFGIQQGMKVFRTASNVSDALKTQARIELFYHHLEIYFAEFAENHVLDTYVFCLSEHDRGDEDGLLSMWRGYGGNGKGAAIIFDTAKITEVPESPLIIRKIVYSSTYQRIEWLQELSVKLSASITKNDIPDDLIHLAAYYLFERLKRFALFSKHSGFNEEREWRIVFLATPENLRDCEHMLHYVVGPSGVEPKLRLKLEHNPGMTADDLSLEKMLHQIILGPSSSSMMAQAMVRRMLTLVRRPELAARVKASKIPYRANF